MNKPETPIPADQFQRVEIEMQKLSQLIEEIRTSLDTAEGLQRIEARRALYEASGCVEIAQFWVQKAISAALKTMR